MFTEGFDKIAKKLTALARSHIKTKNFALPGRSFPIEDLKRAKNALSRAHFASPAQQATIRRKVHAKFPGIGK